MPPRGVQRGHGAETRAHQRGRRAWAAGPDVARSQRVAVGDELGVSIVAAVLAQAIVALVSTATSGGMSRR
jgi:hypothetical protein